MHPPSPSQNVAPLCCPGCGYNLTGVCTVEQPEGNCPECGRRFERARSRDTSKPSCARPNLVVWLLAWPALFAFLLPVASCCLIGMFQDIPGIGMAVALIVILGACSCSGLWLASHAAQAQRAGREPDEVPAFYRYLFWPWLLFTLAHLVLTIVFFTGGCALILGALSF